MVKVNPEPMRCLRDLYMSLDNRLGQQYCDEAKDIIDSVITSYEEDVSSLEYELKQYDDYDNIVNERDDLEDQLDDVQFKVKNIIRYVKSKKVLTETDRNILLEDLCRCLG